MISHDVRHSSAQSDRPVYVAPNAITAVILRICAPLATAQTWRDAIDVLHRPMEADMLFNSDL
jgi:hypothetical protein